MLVKRLIVTLGLLVAMFFLPWWFWLLGLILAALFFAYYYEGLALAFIYDLIFGAWQTTVFHLPFFLTLFMVVVLLLATPIRYRLWH